ncbi:hypothetical protein GF354_00400 [Candidatus Peregrinibacteria bacterium]|nr:hypothetical protein [Candidatus Peregrinibacteria bacterium]
MSDLESNIEDSDMKIETVLITDSIDTALEEFESAKERAINEGICTLLNVSGDALGQLYEMTGICPFTLPDQLNLNEIKFIVIVKGDAEFSTQGVTTPDFDSRILISTECTQEDCNLDEAGFPAGEINMGREYELRPNGNITAITDPATINDTVYISVISGTGDLEVYYNGVLLGVIDTPTLEEQKKQIESRGIIDLKKSDLKLVDREEATQDSSIEEEYVNTAEEHASQEGCCDMHSIENPPNISYPEMLLVFVAVICSQKGRNMLNQLQDSSRCAVLKLLNELIKLNKS